MSGEELEQGSAVGGAGTIEFNPHATSEPKPAPAEEKPKAIQPAPADAHPMRRITVDKVVVNIGVGDAGERLLKAEKVLNMLTGMKPSRTISRTTNRDLGIRKGAPIGCKVTLRKQPALDFLKRAFWVKENRIAGYSFDPRGNFSFGVNDYTDFEGMKYNPDIGIYGMDITVSLMRPGFSVGRRRIARGKMHHSHRITQDEGRDFVRRTFGVEVIQ